MEDGNAIQTSMCVGVGCSGASKLLMLKRTKLKSCGGSGNLAVETPDCRKSHTTRILLLSHLLFERCVVFPTGFLSVGQRRWLYRAMSGNQREKNPSSLDQAITTLLIVGLPLALASVR